MKKLSLFKLGELYLIVEDYTYEDDAADFLFHSHQCPQNMLRKVIAVFDPEHDSDPHGVMRFVAGIDDTPEARALLGDDDRGTNASVTTFAGMLQLFRTDGQPAPSDWPERDNGVIAPLAELQREHRLKTKA